MANIIFYTDVHEIRKDEQTAYAAISWTLTRPWSEGLEDRISISLAAWLALAQNEAYSDAAAAVRAERDARLKASDAAMLIDRMGLKLPDAITSASMLTVVQELFNTLREPITGDAAAYRQALRDVPEQPGFPYDVIWPTIPEDM